MRILFLELIRDPRSDGSLIHRLELARNLSALGNEVHILSLLNDNIDLANIKNHTLNRLNKYLPLPLVYVLNLSCIVYRYNFDYICFRSCFLGIFAILLRFIKGPQLLYEENGIRSEEMCLEHNRIQYNYPSHLLFKLKHYFIKNLDIIVAKRSNKIRAITTQIKDFLIEQGVDPEIIYVIGNGANTDLFFPIQNENILNEVKEKLNIAFDDKIILFVGNLAAWQGVEFLIEAMPVITDSYGNVKFLIVGDGIMKSYLKYLTKKLAMEDKVIFTGGIPYNEVPLYINASDICVAPFVISRNVKTGLSPLKIYEYFACSKPVVSTNIPGIKELLDTSKAGMIVKSESTSELANAIIMLLKNDLLCKEMGYNGLKHVANNCTWRVIAENILDIC